MKRSARLALHNVEGNSPDVDFHMLGISLQQPLTPSFAVHRMTAPESVRISTFRPFVSLHIFVNLPRLSEVSFGENGQRQQTLRRGRTGKDDRQQPHRKLN